MGKKRISSAAHPMVCFCEFNVGEIDSKVITYGNYGVAFSEDWARKHKISPVLYIDENSLAAKGLGTLLRARQNKIDSKKLPEHLRLPIMEIKCFTKHVRGYNSHFKEINFNFKSENEWRYVPEKKSIGYNLISQNKSTYLKRPEFYNNKLKPYPLKFRLSDIELIFVANNNEADILSGKFAIDNSKIRIGKWRTKR